MGAIRAIGGLTDPQDAAFVEVYVRTGIATQAAMEAYGERNHVLAYQRSRRVMARPEIRAALRELARPVLDEHDITAERVMLQLARHAFRDARRAFDLNGELLKPADMDDDTAASITGYEVEEKDGRRTVKVKFVDPTSALTSLAKHFKLIGDVGEGFDALAGELAARLGAARKRVEVFENEGGRGAGGGISGLGGSTPLDVPSIPEFFNRNPKSETCNKQQIPNRDVEYDKQQIPNRDTERNKSQISNMDVEYDKPQTPNREAERNKAQEISDVPFTESRYPGTIRAGAAQPAREEIDDGQLW